MRLPPLDNKLSTHLTSTNSEGCHDARAWFFYNTLDPSDRSHSQSGKHIEYVGLEESLTMLRKPHDRRMLQTD